MIEVNFNRLLEMASIDENHFQWNEDDLPISIDEIIKCKNIGMVGDCKPFGDTYQHPAKEKKNRQYHIERIIYFMENPSEISGINVDNKCGYWGSTAAILPACEIVDGWHRIAAAMALGLQYVKIEYGGRSDIEDYLTGKTNCRPEEDLIF